MQALLIALAFATARAQDLRPPSVPLVVHDPYFSLWSPHDRLTDGWPTHWTGREVRMGALLSVDGVPYRLMGPEPSEVRALRQTSVAVEATTTTYAFECDEVGVQLRFVTPALLDDLDVLARPVTYVQCSVWSNDEREHRFAFQFELAAAVAVDQPAQSVIGAPLRVEGLAAVGVASLDQPVLEKKGDDLRIDWGTAYLASGDARATANYGPAAELRRAFVERRTLAFDAANAAPRRADDGWPAAALSFGSGGDADAFTCTPGVEATSLVLLVAYDDEWSIRYFGDRLRPYWRRNGSDAVALLRAAARESGALFERCFDFDATLRDDLEALGGEKYADLAALSYRQCLGANKLCADALGRPLLFPKENFSNGCVATVDVIYPMAPLFLLAGADLAKAMLVPVLDYGSSARWKFPFAPHDLGTYPHATGQVYGGGERDEAGQMPVEESADLILLVAALAVREGDADFAAKYWPTLARWAAYLRDKGFDPEQQLCTDDFTGHLAHNVNLSCKAILALGAFAQLAQQRGDEETAASYRTTAEDFAAQWIRRAREDDHTLLAFDAPGTWSQKYNLVWDDVLALKLFPAEVKQREAAFYRKQQKTFGLPLDSRATFTKFDWTHWSACLGSRDDFEALVLPLWRYVNTTPDRVPICDWFDTLTARKINMLARPVVGAVFLRALLDEPTWKRWFARGPASDAAWAPLPLVTYETLVPAADSAAAVWRFTTRAPAADWFEPGFDDARWERGEGGFGSAGTPGAVVRSEWNGPEIWLRRSFELAAEPEGTLELWVHHDEDAQIYIDGMPAAELSGYATSYEAVALAPAARAVLHAGRHVLAVHCSQTGGGQYIDVGLVRALRTGK